VTNATMPVVEEAVAARAYGRSHMVGVVGVGRGRV
jgi:hypothetical protein